MTKTTVIAAALLLFTSTSLHANDAVKRALFTTAINNREPVDEVGQLEHAMPKVFFFTEIIGMAGETITHQWQHDGTIKSITKLDIGGDRWRVWSSKKMLPQWTGIWTVIVQDSNGNILTKENMVYIPITSTN